MIFRGERATLLDPENPLTTAVCRRRTWTCRTRLVHVPGERDSAWGLLRSCEASQTPPRLNTVILRRTGPEESAPFGSIDCYPEPHGRRGAINLEAAVFKNMSIEVAGEYLRPPVDAR